MVAVLANKSSSWEIGIKGRKRFNSAWSLSLPPHQADSPISFYTCDSETPLCPAHSQHQRATRNSNAAAKFLHQRHQQKLKTQQLAAGNWQLQVGFDFTWGVCSTRLSFFFYSISIDGKWQQEEGDCRRLMLLFYAIKCLFALLYLNWALPTLRWYMFPPLCRRVGSGSWICI